MFPSFQNKLKNKTHTQKNQKQQKTQTPPKTPEKSKPKPWPPHSDIIWESPLSYQQSSILGEPSHTAGEKQ